MNDPTELEERTRALSARFLERIANDPAFREQLLDDPLAAFETAGFAEDMAAIRRDIGLTFDDVGGYAQVQLPRNLVASESIFTNFCGLTTFRHQGFTDPASRGPGQALG